MYKERTYRNQMFSKDLVEFNVTEYESDLQIFAKSNLQMQAKNLIKKYRKQLEDYIKENPLFLTSLIPIAPKSNAPDIVKHMCLASSLANVGPMAAVAGAISEYVGIELLKYTDEIILENGGDIYLKSKSDKQILIYAGNSPFSNKISLLINDQDTGTGICTSSGTLGHSLSFGKADAVVILSKDTLLADAVATSICNIIKTPNDITHGIDVAKSILGVDGVLIIQEDKMGAWGNVNITKA